MSIIEERQNWGKIHLWFKVNGFLNVSFKKTIKRFSDYIFYKNLTTLLNFGILIMSHYVICGIQYVKFIVIHPHGRLHSQINTILMK
jgi:hypothetical protein